MKVFFDTSAFVKRYIEEPGTEGVVSICDKASVIGLSIISVTEVISTLARLQREKKLTTEQYEQIKETFFEEMADVRLCAITQQMIRRSIQLIEDNTLKTLDALQIGCALEWGVAHFVTSDKLQHKAAHRAGLHAVMV